MIPENKIGDFSIKKNGTVLTEGDIVWMTPAAAEGQQEFIAKATGRVLIGGLGTGLILLELQKKSDITKVDVVEIAQEVIDLVWPYLGLDERFIIHTDDIKNWASGDYDWIYIDTYFMLTKDVYENTVLPLRKLIKNQDTAVFWKEKEMSCLTK